MDKDFSDIFQEIMNLKYPIVDMDRYKTKKCIYNLSFIIKKYFNDKEG